MYVKKLTYKDFNDVERTEEPDEYPDTNIIPGYDLDEPNEPTT